VNNTRIISIHGHNYKLTISNHALTRIIQRQINPENILPAISSIPLEKMEEYNNSSRDIMLIDNSHNCSIIIHVNNYIITVQ